MLPLPQLNGRVIAHGHPEYERARTVFAGAIDRRPAAIARVADTDDVARVIAFARDHGLELAVRSGGHSPAGHGVTEGGLVLDLSEMTALEIDAERRTAWAEAGLTAGAYTAATAEHGLATGFGDAGTVGIGGITLAGGIGYLVRKHGLTIDSLLAAEVVTAGGEVLRADAETYPDLFWAIRGGGGNFGVVTRLQLRLHELQTIVGGTLVLPAEPDVIAAFVAEADAAPDELTTVANVMTAPPLPFLAAEHHGQPVLMATLVWAGAVEDADRVLAPFRALATPLADLLRPMPYPEIYPPMDENHRPVSAGHTMFVDDVDERAAEAIVERLHASTAAMAVAQLRVLGGAMARVPAHATAFAHRRSRMMATVAAMFQAPAERPEHETWVAGLAGELGRPGGGTYVGFLADEGAERVRAAYPGETWDRLAAVKAEYDPGNLFRLNQNVPPAVEEAAA